MDYVVAYLLWCPTACDALNHELEEPRTFDQFALPRTPFRLHQVGGLHRISRRTRACFRPKNGSA